MLDSALRAAASDFVRVSGVLGGDSGGFANLLAASFPRVAPETRWSVAALLADCDTLPRAVIEALLAAPVEDAAPVIRDSPALSQGDIVRLIARRDPAVDRLLEARRAAEPGRSEATPPVSNTTPHPVLDRRQVFAPREPGRTGPRRSAAETRTMLARLAVESMGHRASEPAGAEPADTARNEPRPTPATPEAVGEAARAGDADTTRRGLARCLDVTVHRIDGWIAEAKGLGLLQVTSALGFREADAMTIVMLLRPTVAYDVSRFQAVRRQYAGLDPAGSRRALGLAPEAENSAPAPASSHDYRKLHRRFGRRSAGPLPPPSGSAMG